MDIKRIIIAIIAVAVAGLNAASMKCVAEPPADLIKMKPYVSTAKMGIAVKNDVVMARNAQATALGFRDVSRRDIGGWMFDPKQGAKPLKPGEETEGLVPAPLPRSLGEEPSGVFSTVFTMPSEINGYPIGDSPVFLEFDGKTSLEIYINGKRIKTFTSGGSLDVTGKIKPGESVTLGVKITDMTQKGKFNYARVRAERLEAVKQPADEVASLLDSAAALFDQLPSRHKPLVDAVSSAIKEMEQLKNEKDIDAAVAALERVKNILAPTKELLALYPVFNAGPFLQNVKPDEITVAWETKAPAPSAVYYGRDGLTNVVSDPSPTTFHKVVIKGLERETEYKYLAVSNKLAAPESTFKTSINRDTPFKFAVWGDNQSNPMIFEPTVDLMIKEKPDIIINVGDEVGCGSDYSQWARELFYPLRRLAINTPYFTAIGNHEYCGYDCGKPVVWFEKYMALPPNNGYYYAVTYGNSRFIMLNQQAQAGCAGVVPGTEQYEWLLKELESPEYKTADFHFMFMHKPPYSNCWAGGYYDGEASARVHLVPLIEKYGIDIVFSGHTHDYERGQWPRPDGPYYIITGGGGGGLDDTQYKEWPQMQTHKFVHHFSLVSINGKSLNFSAIDQGGDKIDSFEIVK
jgi:hypothetical protein